MVIIFHRDTNKVFKILPTYNYARVYKDGYDDAGDLVKELTDWFGRDDWNQGLVDREYRDSNQVVLSETGSDSNMGMWFDSYYYKVVLL